MKRIEKYHFLTLCLFVFHACLTCLWLKKNIFTPYWDEARHLTVAINYFRNFPSLFINYSDVGFNLGHSFVYGPLFYLTSVFLKLLLNIPYDCLALTNILFTGLLFFSVFRIGETISGKRAGFFAVLILSFYPIIYGMSRKFMLDYSLTAVLCLSVYLLIKSDYFRNIKYVIFFGLSFAAGLLIKLSFFLVLAGPLFYLTYLSLKKNPRIFIFNYIVFIIIGLGIPLAWYIPGKTGLPEFLIVLRDVYEYLPGPDFLRFSELGFNNLVQQISIFGLIIFVTSLWRLVYFPAKDRKFNIVFVWFIVPFFAFLFYHGYSRYYMPCLPAIALISSVCVSDLWEKKYIKVSFFTAVLFMLINFFTLSFGVLNDLPRFKRIFPTPGNLAWIIHSPNKLNWRAEDVLEFIRRDSGGKDAGISLLADTGFVNNETYAYYSYKRSFNFKIPRSIESDERECFDSEYLVTLKNLRSWHWNMRRGDVLNLNELLINKYNDRFSLISRFDMPGENIIYVYKKK